jgi:hypothetical protein
MKKGLTESQKNILEAFISKGPTKVVYDKKARKDFWNCEIRNRLSSKEMESISSKCPALVCEIEHSRKIRKNIQSAVFSECSYSQTLANMFSLTQFVVCDEKPYFIPRVVQEELRKNGLHPRFAYSTKDGRIMLIQGGGHSGVDSTLVFLDAFGAISDIFFIEFKEPYAKTSEPDLPKFGEDGKIDPAGGQKESYLGFIREYPQFKEMLDEHIDQNYFDIMGTNIHDFDEQHILDAVNGNYFESGKFADVICTEDKDGYLLMVPADQVSNWAKVEGEIRSAGRNHYNVWTPIALRNFLKSDMHAQINGNQVIVSLSELEPRKQRGGNNAVSGYKINPMFFVYIEDCTFVEGNKIQFNINSIQQLNPTIAGKVDFRNEKYNEILNDIENYLKSFH